jgi:hypothetical protein
MLQPGRGSGRHSALWVLLAALLGFVTSAMFSSWLHWPRGAFVLAYAAIAGLFVALYARAAQVRPLVQVRRRWRAGLLGGLLLGGLLAQGVSAQPASARPAGVALAGALAWLGVVYGVVDALLLTVVPVLSLYGSRPYEMLRRGWGRMQWGTVAMLGSLTVTAAYHVGFAEFRGPALMQPLIGNAILTGGYLLTGSPLTPLIGHVIMHAAAVLHGMETTVQLPPHYVSSS